MIYFIFACLYAAASTDVLVTTAKPMNPSALSESIKTLPAQIEAKPLHEKMVSEPIRAVQREQLLKSIAFAEEAALSGKFIMAIKLFEESIKAAEEYPLIGGLDRIIFTSYLKLYELYNVLKDYEKAQVFLKRAKAWDYNAKPDDEVFSPTTRNAFKNLKILNRFKIEFKLSPHALAFLNGKKLDAATKNIHLDLAEGKYQLAVLQPGSQWNITNFYVNKNSAKIINFENQPIVTGDCQAPQISDENLPEYSKLIVFYDQCERVYDGNQWYTMQGEPLAQIKTVQAMRTEKDQPQLIYEDDFNEKPSFLSGLVKSPWFWGAVGAVGIFVYVKSQEQPTVVVPTHSLR